MTHEEPTASDSAGKPENPETWAARNRKLDRGPDPPPLAAASSAKFRHALAPGDPDPAGGAGVTVAEDQAGGNAEPVDRHRELRGDQVAGVDVAADRVEIDLGADADRAEVWRLKILQPAPGDVVLYRDENGAVIPAAVTVADGPGTVTLAPLALEDHGVEFGHVPYLGAFEALNRTVGIGWTWPSQLARRELFDWTELQAEVDQRAADDAAAAERAEAAEAKDPAAGDQVERNHAADTLAYSRAAAAQLEGQEPTRWIDPAEFQRLGYLQEVNRQFLHPLGLALAVHEGAFAGVMDCRDDPEGVYFDEGTAAANAASRAWFDGLAELVMLEQNRRRSARRVRLGFWIQPLSYEPEAADAKV